MWIPASAAEIERAATARELRETASFDAKKTLPIPARNECLAVDVAAMSTDGGVLLYGVGEDRSGQPVTPSPIPLAGAKERVDQIVQTSIAEAPHIEIREYPTGADASVGYLLVVIPQSARAPHQVTVGGNLRFYGRGATGNRVLTEGEIARLYERRRAWGAGRRGTVGPSRPAIAIHRDAGSGTAPCRRRPRSPGSRDLGSGLHASRRSRTAARRA